MVIPAGGFSHSEKILANWIHNLWRYEVKNMTIQIFEKSLQKPPSYVDSTVTADFSGFLYKKVG